MSAEIPIGTSTPGGQRARIRQVLASESMTKREIADALGIDIDDAGDRLRELTKRGRIERARCGRDWIYGLPGFRGDVPVALRRPRKSLRFGFGFSPWGTSAEGPSQHPALVAVRPWRDRILALLANSPEIDTPQPQRPLSDFGWLTPLMECGL